jgi:hypothetical protein
MAFYKCKVTRCSCTDYCQCSAILGTGILEVFLACCKRHLKGQFWDEAEKI